MPRLEQDRGLQEGGLTKKDEIDNIIWGICILRDYIRGREPDKLTIETKKSKTTATIN